MGVLIMNFYNKYLLSILIALGLFEMSCGKLGGNALTAASATSTASTGTTDNGGGGGGGGGCASTAPGAPTTSCSLGCPATSAFVFPTAATTNGGLGVSAAAARTAADNMCLTELNTRTLTLSCKRVKALMSFSATDEMADLPSTCGANITNTTEIYQGISPATMIAASWTGGSSGLLDNNFVGQIEDPGWTNAWTGSNTDGTLGNNCAGFTDGTASANTGIFSNAFASGTTNIFSAGSIQCNNTFTVLCICF